MEKFENKPIEYARFKTSYSDKIVFLDGKYQVSRKFSVRGFDSLMHKWTNDPIQVYTKILPLSALKENPSKSKIQLIYLRRMGLDSLLKPIGNKTFA